MDLREKLIKYFEEQTSNTRGGDIVIYLSTMEDCKEMADEVIELVKKLNDVSNQRELLIAFFKYFRDNGEANIGMSIEQFVDAFLAHNNR